MSSQGPNSPTTTDATTGAGSVTWPNSGNVIASDRSYATAAFSGFSATKALHAAGYGFSIPAGATIDGIVLEIERKASGANEARDNGGGVDLLNSSSTEVGDKGDTGTNYPTSDAYATYGSSADLWGVSWAASDINSANFGGSLGCTNLVSTTTVSVDHMRIIVYYTPAASPMASVMMLLGVG